MLQTKLTHITIDLFIDSFCYFSIYLKAFMLKFDSVRFGLNCSLSIILYSVENTLSKADPSFWMVKQIYPKRMVKQIYPKRMVNFRKNLSIIVCLLIQIMLFYPSKSAFTIKNIQRIDGIIFIVIIILFIRIEYDK